MSEYRNYKHTVQYYETDKMGITHHSNYIRWMEEARIDFLDQIGWNFAQLEASGILSPVVSVECNYKKTTVFAEVITIKVTVSEFKGVKLKLSYVMYNSEGNIVCEAKSSHCFLDKNNSIVNLSKKMPEFHKTLTELADNNK